MRISILLLLLFCISCNKPSKKQELSPATSNKYATLFSISNHKVITIYNYYQNAQQESLVYDLNKLGIRLPVKKVVLLSTTYIGFLDKLDEINAISGLSGTQRIFHSVVLERIKNGQIKEVGYDQNINYETLLSLKPDVIFAYSVSKEELPHIKKIESFGIPVIYVAEYLEKHPLGRAEWIKFFAVFFNKEQMADSIFSTIETSYQKIANLSRNKLNKPKVMLNLPLNDIWYLPDKNSYFVKLIEDGGGHYLFDTLQGKDIHPMNQEWVIFHSKEADIWINAGNYTKLSQFNQAAYRSLKAVRNGNIYNPIKQINASGANNFWEKGVTEPHLILEDFYTIFHNLDTQISLHYYEKLAP